MLLADYIDCPEWRENLSRQLARLKFGPQDPPRVRIERDPGERIKRIIKRVEDLYHDGDVRGSRDLYRFAVKIFGEEAMPLPEYLKQRELSDDEWRTLFSSMLKKFRK